MRPVETDTHFPELISVLGNVVEFTIEPSAIGGTLVQSTSVNNSTGSVVQVHKVQVGWGGKVEATSEAVKSVTVGEHIVAA